VSETQLKIIDFNQNRWLGGQDVKAWPVALGEARTADISGGVCGELVHRWIWARNNLEFLATASPLEDRDEIAVRHLELHKQTIMTGQAMLDADTTSRGHAKVHGMVRDAWDVSSAQAMSDRVAKHRPALFRLSVVLPTGPHAIAIDTRGGELHVFEPNKGHFIAEGLDANRRTRITETERRDRLVGFLQNYVAWRMVIAYTRNNG